MPAEPAAGALYDARRRLYYAKPVLRGWLHAVWFGISLAAGPLLALKSNARELFGSFAGRPANRRTARQGGESRWHIPRSLIGDRQSVIPRSRIGPLLASKSNARIFRVIRRAADKRKAGRRRPIVRLRR